MITGLDGKPHPARREDTTERDALIRELRGQGMSWRAIAARTGCSNGTVGRVLRVFDPVIEAARGS
jgi:DNA invertase Pin-like site-specific DNA recombinase